MLKTLAAAMFAATLVTAVVYGLWSSQGGDAAGIVNRRLIIPGIAMDSQPLSSPAGSVVVSVEMTRHEPALTGSGVTTINVVTSASGPLPSPSGAPVTASAYLSIGTHPSDACAWNIEGASGSLVLTYSRTPVSPLRLTFGIASDISWYYMVQCPGPVPPIRFPAAPVDESFGGWLGLILPGTAGHGATIEVPVVTDPSDVFFGKCRGKLENTNDFGTVTITVTVTDPSCKLPAPTPGPTQSPYEPGIP